MKNLLIIFAFSLYFRVLSSSYAKYSLPTNVIPEALGQILSLNQATYNSRQLADVLAPIIQKTCVFYYNFLINTIVF